MLNEILHVVGIINIFIAIVNFTKLGKTMSKIEFKSKNLFNFLGVLITIASGILAFYLFAKDKKAEIQYSITAQANVFNVNAEVSKLDISYDSISLKKNNQTLRIITVLVENLGNENVTKNYYDDNDPLGIKVSNGKVIEKPELIATSNPYLKKTIKLTIDAANNIYFNPVIIDGSQYFIIKILILTSLDSIPNLTPFGKIAGQNEIQLITYENNPKNRKSNFEVIFGGNVGVLVLRLYTVLMLALLAWAINKMVLSIMKSKRLKKINKYLSMNEYEKLDYKVFEPYAQYDTKLLKSMVYWINHLSEFKEIYFKEVVNFNRSSNEYLLKNIPEMLVMDFKENATPFRSFFLPIYIILKEGYILKQNDEVILNEPLKARLEKFLNFLQNESKV